MKSIISIIMVALAVACKGKSANNNAVTPVDSTNNGSYMPIAAFIQSDIKKADSLSTTFLLRRTANGKKDSSYIQPPAFHQFAQHFLLPELDSASFHDQFTENSLMDQTTQMLNFIYTPKQADNTLQKVIVYVKPTLQYDKVDRIYMERDFVRGDTAIHEKLNWKLEGYFYVLTIKEPKTGSAVTSMEKVIWDPQYFSEE